MATAYSAWGGAVPRASSTRTKYSCPLSVLSRVMVTVVPSSVEETVSTTFWLASKMVSLGRMVTNSPMGMSPMTTCPSAMVVKRKRSVSRLGLRVVLF